MPSTITMDSTEVYHKNWRNKTAETITLVHERPRSSDDWENQMIFLASKGYRVIADGRRGHGRLS